MTALEDGCGGREGQMGVFGGKGGREEKRTQREKLRERERKKYMRVALRFRLNSLVIWAEVSETDAEENSHTTLTMVLPRLPVWPRLFFHLRHRKQPSQLRASSGAPPTTAMITV